MSAWYWLTPEESIVWEGRPRLSTVAGSLAVGVVLLGGGLLAGATVDPRLAALALLGPPIPLWAALRVRHTTYLVTTRALWVKTGVFGRSVRRVTLSRVQNTAYAQSVRGSLFGYGTVTAEVAGGSDVRFRRVSEPRRVQEAIEARTGRRRERSIPGSAEQWSAVLAAVRGVRTAIDRSPGE